MTEIDFNVRTSSQAQTIDIGAWKDYRRLKRGLDLLLAVLLLVLSSPLMLLIALGVLVSSPGPVLFRQKRIGKDGKAFDMIKFRTMSDGSDSLFHQEYVQRLILEDTRPADLGFQSLKLPDDPRITAFGKFLRQLSLDELPQFANVLRGEMSLVGPRPPLPYEYALYNEWHKQRLQVLPGITGLWQVTGHNQVSFSEMVQIDLEYIQRMNLWLDLKIVLMTPLEMLRGKGGG